MQTNLLNRRKALAVIATAPAAVALGAGSAQADGPSELAALIRRYFAERDAFNATHHETDEESDAHAEATYYATAEQMIGVPARTAEDALAALDWLIEEDVNLSREYGDDWGPVIWLVNAIRDYIASTGRVA